jgi:hypothetical protein
MSNTYQLTQQIHEQVQRIAKEKGIEIEIEKNCEEFWYEILDDNGAITQRVGSVYLYEPLGREPLFRRLCPAIQEKQIRQILLAVFGTWKTTEKNHYAKAHNPVYRNRADELEKKWLCFRIDLIDSTYITMPPLFTREPETVLTELSEILKTL